MKEIARAEVQVLNRLAHMLDEHSVQYLAQQDTKFQQFIDELYESVLQQTNKLV